MDTDDRNEKRGGQAEDNEVKVNDRRLFTSDGSLRRELQEQEDEVASGESREDERPRTEPPSRTPSPGFERRSLDEPSGVDFTMLINAMAQPALIFLGEVAHPGSGRPEVDLEQARVQIDLLEVLRIKCRGNLTAEEDGLLDRVLYELRMRYLARSTRAGG